ncbi:MAG TPA: hypothetical protein VKH37_03770, partial [Ferruginibacter sp.]|nr:hypothetical protein [Ferruginibacter sp.]
EQQQLEFEVRSSTDDREMCLRATSKLLVLQKINSRVAATVGDLIAEFVYYCKLNNLYPNDSYGAASTTSKKPPYLLGLIILIPFFGFFAAVILLCLGIFKYKDKWFTIMGAAGILLTAGLYIWLFYSLVHSNIFKRGFVAIARIELNDLVKDVEFYKTQHGHYPEDLRDINEGGSFHSFTDPTQSGNKMFNYEYLGAHYRLFSPGIDGIPNTDDDVYPQIDMGGNVGWVK